MNIELQRGGSNLLLDAVQARDAAGVISPAIGQQMREGGFYVVFDKDTTGGSVVIETAHEAGYAGTWALLATVPWKKGHRTHYVSLPGAHLALRVRVEDAIRGGTVSVYGVGTA